MAQPVAAPINTSPAGEPVVAPAAPVAVNDNDTVTQTVTAPPPAPASNDNPFMPESGLTRPRHTQTQQTLSPTSEFMRYLLAALPSRYTARGLFGGFTETKEKAGGVRAAISNFVSAPGRWLEEKLFKNTLRTDAAAIKKNLEKLEAGGYGIALGAGSMALTHSYSKMVQRDMTNLFAETVGAELGKDPETINFDDIKHSQNRIVQKTVENFRIKRIERMGTDLLFFPAAWMGKMWTVDLALGIKGLQLFADTWKRKTTMFEDLIAFVNNKINPRNGLGQPISQGEMFDLYQHYADTFKTVPMFTNVLERGTGEGAVWASGQPIFQRLTELMNDTYAYKHRTELDANGHAVHKADFTLPKFMYLLGHDLIDPRTPERTLAYLEIANTHGIETVKQAQQQLQNGAKLADVLALYHVALPKLEQAKPGENGKNSVIHKGSTLQLDTAPSLKIDPRTVHDIAPLMHSASAQTIA